ncbi:MAG: hypothetical protein WCV58_03565 [Patescibacteria group bacterium]
MAQKTITVILVLIIIGGLAWYFNKTYLQPSTGHSLEKLPQFKNSPSNGENFEGKLIYTTKGAAREIWQVDVQKESKKLFTDADEAEKFIKVSNLAPYSKEIFVITSAEGSSLSGKLVSIDLVTAKENVLRKTFTVPLSWAVSQDGQKIVYTKFSNIEESYGYTLYLENRDGLNLRELTRNDSEIRLPAWNKDSTKIAFVQNSGVNSKLSVVNVDSTEVEEVKSFENQIIDSVSWSGDKLILSVRSLDNTKEGMIEIINLNGKNLEKVTDYSGGVANFVFLDSSSWLGYLIGQYQGNIDDSVTGQIYIKNLSDKAIPVQKGNQVLGWLP